MRMDEIFIEIEVRYILISGLNVLIHDLQTVNQETDTSIWNVGMHFQGNLM